jgi:hypothetical protein
MATDITVQPTARQLRKMPCQERDAFLQAAAQAAEKEYRQNPELTSFEAFGKGDLHGDSSDAQTR